jgi:hypothetical protein
MPSKNIYHLESTTQNELFTQDNSTRPTTKRMDLLKRSAKLALVLMVLPQIRKQAAVPHLKCNSIPHSETEL